MRATFIEGLPREECENCGAVWMEGEPVAKVMGGAFSASLLRGAKNKPGVCKGCEEPLQFVPSCPRCGLAAPKCPSCGASPLPVVEVMGVKVEVCSGCNGLALDAGELQLLREAAAENRDESLDLRPQVSPEAPPQCTACKRKLKPEHAFVWDERFYCGSCAPQGAAPYSGDLTKARPSQMPDIGRGRYGLAGGTLDDTPTESAMLWLFSKIFR